MVWTIEYADSAKQQLRKLDRQIARRILDFMEERVSGRDDPRSTGKALTGPMGGLWRYRMGDYRIVCSIEDTAVRILVVRIGNRREVYC